MLTLHQLITKDSPESTHRHPGLFTSATAASVQSSQASYHFSTPPPSHQRHAVPPVPVPVQFTYPVN
ncbi:hypothetical protein GOODEAATRI_027976 [Goodea atripinnis]|uniref:Uncharacterized protein n=1 Tax=Goodea atripinnis TaxID=208336 RepID=A0ABV0P8B7_9TELE